VKHTIFVLITAVFLAAPTARGQAPVFQLNCDQTRFFVSGLVPYCEIRDMAIPYGGSLGVKTVNGNISVLPWDGQDVLVHAQVMTAAENESLAAGLAALVTVDTSSGNVLGGGPSTNEQRQWSLSLEIYVPAQAAPSLTTVNGNISVSDIQGAIQFSATNGNVSVVGAGGDVEGHGVNGNITVAAGGDHWQGQTLDVRTVNGNVDLSVPGDCSAHVELSTVLGRISTNFQVTLGKSGPVTFDLGSGGGLVRGATTLGNVRLAVESDTPMRRR